MAVGTYVTHCKGATVNTASYSLAYTNGTLTIVATAPLAPTEVKATAGNASASVSFKAPTSNGGAVITSYIVMSNNGITATGTKSPIIVPGLQNGVNYTFKALATNSKGNSAYSAVSAVVTPSAKIKK